MITRQDALDLFEEHAGCSSGGCLIIGAIIGALHDMADRIDNGPVAPLPPSVIAELVRERAAELARTGLEDDEADPS